MTDPTPKQLAMARRIAADTWGLTGPNRQAVINGEWDDIRQVRCALAAIIETTEAAAQWLREDAAKTRDDFRRLHAGKKLTPGQTAEWELLIALKSGLASAIERNEHLKGQSK